MFSTLATLLPTSADDMIGLIGFIGFCASLAGAGFGLWLLLKTD